MIPTTNHCMQGSMYKDVYHSMKHNTAHQHTFTLYTNETIEGRTETVNETNVYRQVC